MSGVWEIGPFILKQSTLIVIFIVIFGVYLANQLVLETERKSKSYNDLFLNGVFLFFVVFQFSSLLFYFTTSLKDPLASLAMPSGSAEWMLAWVCLILYLFWKAKKKNIVIEQIINHIVISYFVIETMYVAFFPYAHKEYPISLFQMVINVGLISYFYWNKQKDGISRKLLSHILVVYGFMLGVLSLVVPIRMMQVTVPSYFYFLIAITGLIAVSVAVKGEKR